MNITTGAGWTSNGRTATNRTTVSFTCATPVPCAMCEEERGKSGRRPGDPATAAPGALLIFKPHAKPISAEGVGKYAIKFSWNDNHDLGIYSW